MTRLIYIANARIPTEKAHGIQIMKMCEAFANFQPASPAGGFPISSDFIESPRLSRDNLQTNSKSQIQNSKLEVELIIPRRLNTIKKDPFDYYGVRRNFKITKLPTLDLITFGLGRFGFFVELVSFLLAAKIYLLFKKYDILYTRETLTGLFFKNAVIELHSLPTSPAATSGVNSTSQQNFLFQKILKRAKVFLVLTGFLKKELIEFGVPENKILVLPDAVDLEKFDIKISQKEARDKLSANFNIKFHSDKKIIVYVGQLFSWKGVDTLVSAAKGLKNLAEFYVVGGLFASQDVSGIFSSSHFVGLRPYSEIPLWLKAADVLILPNSGKEKISKYYTSPMKLFEYMASGRPIVASDLPSLREILTEKEAVFFKPDDAEDLTEKIKNVLNNPQAASDRAQNALKKVQNYTWTKRALHGVDFINNVR